MERVVIIGCGGSGKSTLARQLGEKTGLPVIHLDQIYWRPGNWQHISKEEFAEELEELLKQPQWIMDGNFNNTMEKRLAVCDTVIYLDYNRFVCLWGLFKRVIINYGKARQDMAPGCKEKFDPEFAKWIWNYNKNNRSKNYARIAAAPHANAIILKNRRQTKRFMNGV